MGAMSFALCDTPSTEITCAINPHSEPRLTGFEFMDVWWRYSAVLVYFERHVKKIISIGVGEDRRWSNNEAKAETLTDLDSSRLLRVA